MTELIDVAGSPLAVKIIGGIADGPTVVMLHEGLGCITQWRDLPDRIHSTTGLPVVSYDRSGYGRSPWGVKRYAATFMHEEAQLTLPVLLQNLNINQPVLIGHSDGGTIALIAAACGSVTPIAVATIAAHIFVEQAGLDGVNAATSRRNQIVEGMSRHHNDAAATFDRWSSIWRDPDFASFDMSDILTNISCPLLVLQGDRDEYATAEMVHGVTRRVPHAIGRFLPDCGHIAHRDQPDLVAAELTRFVSDALNTKNWD